MNNISRGGSGGGGSPYPRAYLFDGVNDYIAGDTTIGRGGYDLNVAGNVSTGSDADGSYIHFNGNRDATVPSGTAASMVQGTGVSLSHASGFTISTKFKANGVVPSSGSMGLYGSSNIISLYLVNTAGVNVLTFRIRNGGTFTDVTYNTVVGTAYTAHGVYDATNNKMYLYVDGVLQNIGGTTVAAATFGGAQVFYLGDLGVGGGNVKSASLHSYWSATRNVALTQAEIDADIALGNTTKSDSRIVAYYVPENLQYNTQYLSNPKDLSNATRTKGTGTTVTADFSVAPDGTTTADQVDWTGTDIATSRCDRTFTTITGGQLASKTFIVKAFVKVASGTALFRLRCSHNGVADYYSSNQTATTVRQEFTFTQAFTSSSSGTGVTAGLVIESGLSAATLEVWNVRQYITNETLRDESPNIGGYIGWKTNKVFSCWMKPNADPADSAQAGGLIGGGWAYLHDRSSTHQVQIRYDSRTGAKVSIATLGASYRSRVHIIGSIYFEGGVFKTKIYVNGSLIDSDTWTIDAPTAIVGTVIWSGRLGTTYFNTYIRDARIYTGTITDDDALAIYNGGEPETAVKYIQWKPNSAESGVIAQDRSGNSRTGTLTGGTTRVAVPAS